MSKFVFKCSTWVNLHHCSSLVLCQYYLFCVLVSASLLHCLHLAFSFHGNRLCVVDRANDWPLIIPSSLSHHISLCFIQSDCSSENMSKGMWTVLMYNTATALSLTCCYNRLHSCSFSLSFSSVERGFCLCSTQCPCPFLNNLLTSPTTF